MALQAPRRGPGFPRGDVDGDGRFTPVDQNDLVSGLPSGDPSTWHDANAVRLEAGKYLIQIFVPEPHSSPVPFDLRTWTVDDPKPDDPEPAPGLVVDHDAQQWPAEAHTFVLQWNGVGGDEPLRGLIDWQGASPDDHLAASVVRVRPASG